MGIARATRSAQRPPVSVLGDGYVGYPLIAMRALVQRVTRASVSVGDRQVAAIGPGLLVLLGISREDDSAAADRLADRKSTRLNSSHSLPSRMPSSA